MEIAFYPDLAVTLGKQNLWAVEVKLLKRTGRQSSITTALGQASLYKSRYEHVLVVLIDSSPSSALSQKSLINQGKKLGLNIVIRPRVGKILLQQAVHK